MKIRQAFLFLSLALIVATRFVPAFGEESDLADNGALQYWKAFALMPELSESQDDAVRKALDDGQLDESLEKILKSCQSAFRELRKGAGYEKCCWGISLEEGPNATLSHLSKARQLARLACLDAESSFQQGRASEAINRVGSVIALGQHVGRDAVLISLLVDYAIERMAIETTAANLPSLDDEQLKSLQQRLDSLADLPTVAQAVAAEKELFVGWMIHVLWQSDGKEQLLDLFGSSEADAAEGVRKHSREELSTAAKQLYEFYDRLVEAVALRPDEVMRAEQELIANPGIDSPAREFAQAITPAIGAARSVEAVHQTRLALLKAAVAVRQDGPHALGNADHRDPFGEGPFEYSETEGGFTLRSAFADRKDQPITLSVGRTD